VTAKRSQFRTAMWPHRRPQQAAKNTHHCALYPPRPTGPFPTTLAHQSDAHSGRLADVWLNLRPQTPSPASTSALLRTSGLRLYDALLVEYPNKLLH